MPTTSCSYSAEFKSLGCSASEDTSQDQVLQHHLSCLACSTTSAQQKRMSFLHFSHSDLYCCSMCSLTRLARQLYACKKESFPTSRSVFVTTILHKLSFFALDLKSASRSAQASHFQATSSWCSSLVNTSSRETASKTLAYDLDLKQDSSTSRYMTGSTC